MLSRLIVKNFKSIGEKGIDLELKPLTILVGPNGSGKSSVLEALALLSANVEQDEFRLKGELTQSFEAPQQIAHKHELSRWITWEIHLPDSAGVRYEYKLDSAEKRETIIEAGKDILQASLVGYPRLGHKAVSGVPGGKQVVLGNTLIPLGYRKYRYDLYDNEQKNKMAEVVPKVALQALLSSAASTVSKVATTLKERLFLLPHSRGQFLPWSGFTAVSRFVGIKGESLITVLNVLQGSTEFDYQRAFKHIQFWAKEFGLLKLTPGLQPDGRLGVRFADPALKTTIDLAFAGHGSRQIASVITQLFWALPESMILIEEPEISLHPEAQVKLGELFADAVLERKQILATTHSDFLLLSLSRAVEKGVKVKDMAVYEVSKGPQGTTAKPVKLSKRGYPLGWPPSYEKVQRQVAFDWAKGLAKE